MKLTLYYADWCGHCKRMKQMGGQGSQEGGWTTLEKKAKAGKLNFKLESFEENKIPENIRSKISGYPTIKLFNDKGVHIADYMGDRSAKDMEKFVKQHQSQRGGKSRRRRVKRKSRRRRVKRKSRRRRVKRKSHTRGCITKRRRRSRKKKTRKRRSRRN